MAQRATENVKARISGDILVGRARRAAQDFLSGKNFKESEMHKAIETQILIADNSTSKGHIEITIAGIH